MLRAVLRNYCKVSTMIKLKLILTYNISNMVAIKVFYTCLYLCVFSSTFFALAEESTTEAQYIEYEDHEYNVTRVIDLTEIPDVSVLQKSSSAIDKYLLFTRHNPTSAQQLIPNNSSSILNSDYNPDLHTVVIVHGWTGNQNSKINPTIKNAYLNANIDANIIVVDWSRVAISDYVTATVGVPGVGRTLGQFLAFLVNTAGGSYDNMHLVGFSLGAHVVGNAGKYLDGRVARITGLDPAGPLWGINPNRLTAANAVYVEAIHTSTLLGTADRSGDVDFYPNGGSNQPGCSSASCSHSRSWELFTATIIYDHLLGRKCYIGIVLCTGVYLHMGNDDLKKTGSGKFKLMTKSTYPYEQV